MADEGLYPKVDYDVDLPPDTMATLDMNGVDPHLFRRLDGWKEPAEAEVWLSASHLPPGSCWSKLKIQGLEWIFHSNSFEMQDTRGF